MGQMKKCSIPILHNFSRSTTFVLCKFSFETHILNYLYICKFAQKDFGFIQFLTWFWLKFNWAHVNWSTSHEPTKILCTFLNWNLSSFSLFFFSPLISFVYFDFYLTSPLELIAHIFLLSLKCGAVIVFKCTDTWGVTRGASLLVA